MNRKLTKTAVENAPVPSTGDAWIWDTELPGFGLRVKSSGRKTYVVRYRTRDGRHQRKMTLCRAIDATPEKARALARDVFLAVAAGEDPAMERRPAKGKEQITLGDMFQGYVDHLRAKGKASAYAVEHQLLLSSKNSADALGRDRAPSEITPNDIIKHLASFYREGHRGAANKARSYIHAAYNWAIKSAHDYTVEHRKDWGVTYNPASAVAKDTGAEQPRDRNLSANEIRTLWQACEDGSAEFNTHIAILVQTLICCGQRVQETLRMCGEDIDLDACVWRIPKHKTKTKKHDHIVPLSRHIVPKLKLLKAVHGDGPLFPARYEDTKSGLLTANGVSQAIYRWTHSGKCPIEHFQARDLRRTWKSRAHDAGIDRFTRDLIQQHAKNDTGSKHYDRADYLPQMREAMDKWDDWLDRVLYGEPVVLKAA